MPTSPASPKEQEERIVAYFISLDQESQGQLLEAMYCDYSNSNPDIEVSNVENLIKLYESLAGFEKRKVFREIEYIFEQLRVL